MTFHQIGAMNYIIYIALYVCAYVCLDPGASTRMRADLAYTHSGHFGRTTLNSHIASCKCMHV